MNQKDFEEIMKVQQLMSQRLMQEQTTDNKITVLNILQGLSESNQPVQTEALLLEAQTQGISADEAQDILQTLIQDQLVKRPKTGYVQLT